MFVFQKYGLLEIPRDIVSRSEWASKLYQYSASRPLANPLYDIFWNVYIGGSVKYNCNLWAIRYEFIVPVLIVLLTPIIKRRSVRISTFIAVCACCTYFLDSRLFYVGCMLLGMLLSLTVHIPQCKTVVKLILILGTLSFIYTDCFAKLIADPQTTGRLFNLLTASCLIYVIIHLTTDYKNRILGSSVLITIGSVSYEIYVFHLFFILAFSPRLYLSIVDWGEKFG